MLYTNDYANLSDNRASSIDRLYLYLYEGRHGISIFLNDQSFARVNWSTEISRIHFFVLVHILKFDYFSSHPAENATYRILATDLIMALDTVGFMDPSN